MGHMVCVPRCSPDMAARSLVLPAVPWASATTGDTLIAAAISVHRGPPRSSSSDPDFVVVDGVPVLLPSYDEAVSDGVSALGPGFLAAMGQGCPVPVDDQSPPAYPGDEDMGTGDSSETCDSTSGSSELLQSLYPPPSSQTLACPASEDPDAAADTGEAASTSPGIDIADGECLPIPSPHAQRSVAAAPGGGEHTGEALVPGRAAQTGCPRARSCSPHHHPACLQLKL